MVDTLAPKKIFTERELNTKLTPVSEQVLRTKPRPSLLDDRPKVVGTATSLIDKQSQDFLLDSATAMPEVATAEQKQTAKSSEETIDEKQTGMRAEREVAQGLGARPGIMYAETGVNQMSIDRPMVVGEKGPEMVVPAGKNKFSVIPTNELKDFVQRVGGLMSDTFKKVKDKFDAPTEEELQKKLRESKEAEIIRDNILLQMEEQYGIEDMKRQAEMGLIDDGGRYTNPDFVPPSQKYNMKLIDSD